ncbi:unnamed protein product [Arctia plantaginis]|uniref:Uncharacterized protein n=1 Tax=Arctia plantaginis TaxID=874455 RepID=A0A8S1AK46_ARCPL|nr:unnamed protein product [Arctia plantaginis]
MFFLFVGPTSVRRENRVLDFSQIVDIADVRSLSTRVTKQKRWLPFETIILFVITLGRELATWFSRRGDSKAVNTEAQILLRIIYRQDCDLKMVQQDLT